MNKSVLIIILLLLSINAQSQQARKFYAIDGTSWLSQKERDQREELLWKEIDLSIRYAEISQNCSPEFLDLYAGMSDDFKSALYSLRAKNNSLRILYSEGIKKELDRHNVKIEQVYSSNNESFYMKELGDAYNVLLDGYDLVYAVSRRMSDSDYFDLNADELTKIILYNKQYKEARKDYLSIAGKIDEVLKQMNYSGELPVLSASPKTEEYIPFFFYAIDGLRFISREGRDNYDTKLEAKIVAVLDDLRANAVLDEKLIADLEDENRTVFECFSAFKRINGKLRVLSDEKVRYAVQTKYPDMDLNSYKALNNEMCYLRELKDMYDGLTGMYDIITGLLEDVEKRNKENIANKNHSGKVLTAEINFEELRDSQGNSPDEVVNKTVLAVNKLNEKCDLILNVLEDLE